MYQQDVQETKIGILKADGYNCADRVCTIISQNAMRRYLEILELLSQSAAIFLAIPGKVGVRAAGTCADTGLGGSTSGKHKGGT